jgi:hypothetical protein
MRIGLGSDVKSGNLFRRAIGCVEKRLWIGGTLLRFGHIESTLLTTRPIFSEIFR